MKQAPAFDCARCRRRIGKHGHYLLDTKAVVCTRCIEHSPAHGEMYADCPHRWHDLLDHLDTHGTRAGIAAVLGIWP